MQSLPWASLGCYGWQACGLGTTSLRARLILSCFPACRSPQLRESARIALPVAAAVTGAAALASANDEVVPAPSYPFAHKGPFSSW